MLTEAAIVDLIIAFSMSATLHTSDAEAVRRRPCPFDSFQLITQSSIQTATTETTIQRPTKSAKGMGASG